MLAGFSATAQPPRENHWDISKIDVSKLPAASTKTDVTFVKDILPLFKASCVRCHGAEKPRAGMRLDNREAVLKGGRDGKMVVTGDSKASLLAASCARIDDSIAMPPKRRGRGPGGPGTAPGGTNAPAGGKAPAPAKALTVEEAGLVRAWIDQGAK